MIPDACTSEHTCRNVLALLKLGHRVTRQTSEHGIVQVQASCNEGMDNFLTRIAVEESSDFVKVSDMVAGRLRERVYVGDHGHVRVKDCTQVPDRRSRGDQRFANIHTRQGDLR